MPVYEFHNPATGETIECVLPVSRRDEAPPGFVRVVVPRRVNVIGFARNPYAAENQVLDACKHLEETHKGGSAAFRRELDWTPDQIKTLWSEEYGNTIPDYDVTGRKLSGGDGETVAEAA